MEPLMCLGFSSGIQFYQEKKVLVGLSAERKPGAVWLGGGVGGVVPRCFLPAKPAALGSSNKSCGILQDSQHKEVIA